MVYVFLADGFEEVEALTPVDYLRRAGIKTVTVGVNGIIVNGAHGIPVMADYGIDDVVLDDTVEGIILPGGMPGTLNLEAEPIVKKSIDFANENNLMIAAICAAPSILGHRNLLKDKKAVCFPGFEEELTGATITDDYCVTDGNIITAKGAGAAPDFAFEIIKYLCSAEEADKIKAAVQTPCR